MAYGKSCFAAHILETYKALRERPNWDFEITPPSTVSQYPGFKLFHLAFLAGLYNARKLSFKILFYVTTFSEHYFWRRTGGLRGVPIGTTARVYSR